MSKISCDFIFSNFISVDFFLILSVVVLLLFSYLFIKNIKRSRVGDFGLLFLVLGASANIFERAKFGCVADYLNFFNLFYFNIQDLIVTVGLILLLWAICRKN